MSSDEFKKAPLSQEKGVIKKIFVNCISLNFANSVLDVLRNN